MKILALVGVLAASLYLGGCASYQMGSSNSLPYKSVSVSPPRNLSNLPQLEGPLNAALRQAIQQDGELTLSTSSNADSVLEITVLEVRRAIAAVTSEDVGRGRKFELVVDVELTLRQPGENGTVFIDARRFTIERDVFADSGLVDAEYQAVPEVSRLIAERTAEILVDLW